MENINNTLIDSAFNYRGEKQTDKRIVIVDIDERSLLALGQWPWSRHKVAKILENLTDANVGIIGLDVIFAEKDRSSPKNIAKELGIKKDELLDYDEVLAKTLQNTPTITGFVFNMVDKIEGEAPYTDSMFVEHNKDISSGGFMVAAGVKTNIEIIQQSSYSSGSFNTLPDDDGVVRYVPLLFSYEGELYPSLSFEMIRQIVGERRVDIIYDESGVDFIKVGDLKIPTDVNGRLFVNYRGAGMSYHYISAVDVYNNSFDKDEIDQAIVLLGTSAAGLLDLRATPFDSTYPGVEVHANVIDNILNGDVIVSPSSSMGNDLLAIFVSVFSIYLIFTFATPMVSFGLVISFLALQVGFYQYMLFDDHLLLNYSFPLLASILSIFAMTFIKIYQVNRLKEMIAKKFSKKVSPQVVDKLLKSDKDAFSVSQTEVTIFFSDVRDFTTISESFGNPKDLIEYLNLYMSPMSQIIIDHEGTIDKYIGDAIMAYWNAPLEVKDHADMALSAAIKQIEALKVLNIRLKQMSYPAIKIGIGIHTGEAIVGEMGSEGRSDYTVIGDSINLGSRIEGLCKPYGAEILISQSTKDRLVQEYQIREIDRVQVKGKEESIKIYEVFGFGSMKREDQEIEQIYKEAKELYFDSKFDEAYGLFFKVYELKDDKIFAIYMDRCASYLKNDIKKVDEVFKFTMK
jgi:adenylate cyclase